MSLFSKRRIILSAFLGLSVFPLAEMIHVASAELNKHSHSTVVRGMGTVIDVGVV